MKNLDLGNPFVLLQRGALGLLAALALGVPTWSQIGGGNTPIPPPDTSVPEEGVGGLPILAGGEGAGFRLSGSITDLRSVLLDVQGKGRIDVQTDGSGTFHLHFQGSFAVRLDPDRLASGSVKLSFLVRTALPGGSARFGLDRARVLELPLSDLAGGLALPVDAFHGFQGVGMFVEAVHPDLGFVRSAVGFAPDAITLYQLSGR